MIWRKSETILLSYHLGLAYNRLYTNQDTRRDYYGIRVVDQERIQSMTSFDVKRCESKYEQQIPLMIPYHSIAFIGKQSLGRKLSECTDVLSCIEVLLDNIEGIRMKTELEIRGLTKMDVTCLRFCRNNSWTAQRKKRIVESILNEILVHYFPSQLVKLYGFCLAKNLAYRRTIGLKDKGSEERPSQTPVAMEFIQYQDYCVLAIGTHICTFETQIEQLAQESLSQLLKHNVPFFQDSIKKFRMPEKMIDIAVLSVTMSKTVLYVLQLAINPMPSLFSNSAAERRFAGEVVKCKR